MKKFTKRSSGHDKTIVQQDSAHKSRDFSTKIVLEFGRTLRLTGIGRQGVISVAVICAITIIMTVAAGFPLT